MAHLTSLLIFLMLVIAQAASGVTNTVIVDNGDWAVPGTWSLGRIPETGDLVSIPGGMTVQITSNMYNSPPQPVITINVHGVLLMTGTGQLNLSAGSGMYVIGGGSMPSTGCNCNQLNFGGGAAEWKGKDPGLNGGSCLPAPCTPLKETTVAFEASSKGDQTILEWETTEEVNMDRYEIERSGDAINFENRGSVKATGKVHNDYSFTDNNPENISYYRLKQVEKNNTISYSAVVTVKKEAENSPFSLEVYPNPASSAAQINVHINAHEEKEDVLVVLEDMMGKHYFSKVIIVEKDLNIVIENTEGLTPGIYMIVASSNHKFYSERVLIR
jgi:hypothetical protein